MNEEMKKLIKETIVEMIRNRDLEIRSNIVESNYDKQLITYISYNSDDALFPELIQENKQEID